MSCDWTPDPQTLWDNTWVLVEATKFGHLFAAIQTDTYGCPSDNTKDSNGLISLTDWLFS